MQCKDEDDNDLKVVFIDAHFDKYGTNETHEEERTEKFKRESDILKTFILESEPYECKFEDSDFEVMLKMMDAYVENKKEQYKKEGAEEQKQKRKTKKGINCKTQ